MQCVFIAQCVSVCLNVPQCASMCLSVSKCGSVCRSVERVVCEHKLLFCVGGHQRRWNLCRVPMMMTIMIIIIEVANIMIGVANLLLAEKNFENW